MECFSSLVAPWRLYDVFVEYRKLFFRFDDCVSFFFNASKTTNVPATRAPASSSRHLRRRRFAAAVRALTDAIAAAAAGGDAMATEDQPSN